MLIQTMMLATAMLVVPGKPANHHAKESIYSFKVTSLAGTAINFAEFKGKKILVVNTASKCGFTPQYADLEKLYNQFKGKLIIVGFPCNQFAGQAPGTSKDISEFCTNKYHITFPMAEKIEVKGDHTAPIYQWLESEAKAKGFTPVVPQWNFGKYLLNEQGELVAVFSSPTNPMSQEVVDAIAK
ncbi:MAG: glutathione peroxidase [Chitinophagaceae bacterium]